MEHLKELRIKKGVLQKDVADYLQLSRTTYVKYENQDTEPDEETILKLSEYFGVTTDYLLGKSKVPNGNKEGVRIPVFGHVAAGIPISAIEDIIDYEEITRDMAIKGEYFGLVLKGDSMEPRMTTGDVVIVRAQPTAETGDIAIVLIGNEEGTCKKIKKTPEGIMLISLNPAYEPMFYSNKQIEQLPVTIMGKVVELRAKF